MCLDNLHGGNMKWYKFDIRELTCEDYQKWYALMNRPKQARVDHFRFDEDKKRTVAGEMLARLALAAWCNVSPESIVFAEAETSKPYAMDLPAQFNISHCGDMVVCAVDSAPVGIDIEKIRPISLKIAKRVCTEAELLYLFGHVPTPEDYAYTTDSEMLRRFYELWTQKEAICKLKGVGLSGLCSVTGENTIKTQHITNGEYIICIASQNGRSTT